MIMIETKNETATTGSILVEDGPQVHRRNNMRENSVEEVAILERNSNESEEKNGCQVVRECESVFMYKVCEVCGNPFQAIELIDNDKNQRPLITTCDTCSYYMKPRTFQVNKPNENNNQITHDVYSSIYFGKDKLDISKLLPLEKSAIPSTDREKTFVSDSQLIEHSQSDHGPHMETEKLSGETIMCDNCGKIEGVFTITENMTTPVNHCEMCYFERQNGITDPNTPSDTFKCDLCERQFSRKDHVTRHRMTHLDLKPFECYLCAKSFNRNDKLTRHLRTHPDAKPFCCKVCFQSFIVRADLLKHTATHPSDSRLYKCDLCNKTFMDKIKLSRHYFTHDDYKPYKCEFCGKTFKLEDKLLSHQQTHSNWKPYVCKTCGLTFRIKYSYDRHLIVHSEEKVYTCHVCLKSFNHCDNLRTHHLTHVEIRPYRCEICDRAFKFNDKLKRHRNEVHGLDRDAATVCGMIFKCEICDKSFDCDDDLTEHKMVHYRC